MSEEEGSSPSSEAVRNLIVAIDGPAGAGKSTVARRLARHFGLLNLETGAMYRAFALKALRAGLPLDATAALEELASETAIRLESGEAENRVLLDGEDVTGLIRNPARDRRSIAGKRFSCYSRLDGAPAAATWRTGRSGDGRPRYRHRGLSPSAGKNLS